jgi:RHS repeat-associated protein
MRYTAWGEVRYTWGSTPTDYTYTGQYSNVPEFGLYYYNARWYDGSLGRFAQADSIVPPGVQGLDRYAYVNNNAIRYIDPTGHFTEDELAKFSGYDSVDALRKSKLWRRWEKLGITGILTSEKFTWGSMLSFQTRKGTINLMAVQGKTDNLMFWDIDDKKSYSPYTVFEFSSRDGEIYTDRTGFVSPTASAGFYSTSPTGTGSYSRADCNGNRACEQVPVPILPSGWQYGQGESVQIQKNRDPLTVAWGGFELFAGFGGAFATGVGVGMGCGASFTNGGISCGGAILLASLTLPSAWITVKQGLDDITINSVIDTTIRIR